MFTCVKAPSNVSQRRTFLTVEIGGIRVCGFSKLRERLQQGFMTDLFGGPFEQFIDAPFADPTLSGDCVEIHHFGAVFPVGFPIDLQFWSSEMTTIQPCPPQPGLQSFLNHRPLQFRNRSLDCQYCSPQRSAGIGLFPEADELDIRAPHFLEDVKEVHDRSGQPVAGPYEQHIELALAGIRHHTVETWPLCLGARNFVSVDFGNLQASLLGQLPEIMQLSLGMLIKGGNAQVQGGSLLSHGFLFLNWNPGEQPETLEKPVKNALAAFRDSWTRGRPLPGGPAHRKLSDAKPGEGAYSPFRSSNGRQT
jgi:hypothetical protein